MCWPWDEFQSDTFLSAYARQTVQNESGIFEVENTDNKY